MFYEILNFSAVSPQAPGTTLAHVSHQSYLMRTASIVLVQLFQHAFFFFFAKTSLVFFLTVVSDSVHMSVCLTVLHQVDE